MADRAIMSFEFAYRFKQDGPPGRFHDLEDVVLLVVSMSDDGDTIAAGTQGTIVSVHGAGESYVVEFDIPDGAPATVLPHEIEPAESYAR